MEYINIKNVIAAA